MALELPGQHGHKIPTWAWIGGALIVGYLVLQYRSQGQTTGAGAGATGGGGGGIPGTSELYTLGQQASDQLGMLTAMNQLQATYMQDAYNLAAGVNPGLQRTCWGYNEWIRMDPNDRKQIQDEVKNGKGFLAPTAQGLCFTPTLTGFQGHQPLVTTSQHSGFFSSSSSTTGPAGSFTPYSGPAPQSGLNALLNDALGAFGIYSGYPIGGVSGGGYTPPIAPTMPGRAMPRAASRMAIEKVM